jgi:type I restriction enzyme, R subunit
MAEIAYALPLLKEDHVSQVPALQLLQNLGWNYLMPQEALAARGERLSGVILDGILERQLRTMNRIRYRREELPFSEANIISAIQALKGVYYDGLIRTNEKVYDLLSLGKSLQQSIQGDVKSFTLQYIDWNHPERNVYHVTEEFAVERKGSREIYRVDVVLFVNGIPFGIIECKRPDLPPGHDPIEQAISQHIRNQKDDGIPSLFVYSQILLALSKNDGKYGTTGTPEKFWAKWKETIDYEEELRELVNRPLSDDQKERLFRDRFGYVRLFFDAIDAEGGREVTEQDRLLWSLCQPERLLELSYEYLLFDAGEKKIARYQQYFTVRNILKRIRTMSAGRRAGGVVWHTQGSGKSLTMVMLAKAIAVEQSKAESREWDDYKIILVTDRVDLDDQIFRTFKHCGIEPEQAATGKRLGAMLGDKKQRVITTVINKFEAAIASMEVRLESPNIFVLIDEGHRTQYGSMNAKMRRALPNACYIAFTGTPVVKREKNTVERFGGLIQPVYTIGDAVSDKEVVPLLYESRYVQQRVDQKSIDEWFERVTANLSDDEKADLKRKFATTDMLFRAEPVVRAIAWDVSEHFRQNWQGTPFKGQLVTPRKETALLYKKYLDEFGMVETQVLISPPDDREGEEELYKETNDPVLRFWKSMMDRYGTPKEYERQVINGFKYGDPSEDQSDAPEIIIVVDKLLTGFDCPRNTVLYLARQLRDHTLLQAIARVNRLHEGKDYGYIIDYRGVLVNLDEALDFYATLREFDADDLAGIVTDISTVIDELPQRHSALWDIFKAVPNKRDTEAYERLLADEALRVEFYERFGQFARNLAVALSSVAFLKNTPETTLTRYKADLKFFSTLRASVRRRYAERVDFSEYEPKIKKLLDTYIATDNVQQITGPIDLFSKEARAAALEQADGDAAKADVIAHNTRRVLQEKWQREDPAFYKKFSRMLQDVIDEFRARRLDAADYLRRATAVMDSVLTRTGDDVPEEVAHNETAKAYYGSIKDIFERRKTDGIDVKRLAAEAGLNVDRIIESRRIVNWTSNVDVQNRMRQELEDYLFELKGQSGMPLAFEDIDTILDETLDIAKVRCP